MQDQKLLKHKQQLPRGLHTLTIQEIIDQDRAQIGMNTGANDSTGTSFRAQKTDMVGMVARADNELSCFNNLLCTQSGSKACSKDGKSYTN